MQQAEIDSTLIVAGGRGGSSLSLMLRYEKQPSSTETQCFLLTSMMGVEQQAKIASTLKLPALWLLMVAARLQLELDAEI